MNNRAMPPHRLLHALPAHIINGVGVALGIGLAQGLAAWLGDPAAALAAASGAVYASLADLPNPPHRGWRRVLTASLIGCVVSLLMSLLHTRPVMLGIAIGVVGFCSVMTLAWGARAGPISFVGILAFVFTMAMPPVHDLGSGLAHLGWTALGAGTYLAWSVVMALSMRRRYRTLALDAALEATAGLLRARAAVLTDAPPQPAGKASRLQDWISRETKLDERLQAARDMLFAAPEGDAAAQRQIALLLLAIDLRDTLLLGELDLDVLGHDAPGVRLRRAMAATLGHVADALEAIGDALRLGQALPEDGTGTGPGIGSADAMFVSPTDTAIFPDRDPRAPMLPVMRDRARRLVDDLQQMQALMRGATPWVPLGRAELQLFVSSEGWPLAALKRHATLRSPVTRHAVRLGAALACAYFVARALPWSSHPYWLVLSVAVVLRGTLEQTLSRRNARVLGTVVGCLIVLAIVQTRAAGLAALVFLAAAGIAHAFVAALYGVTATAATVMALLQAQMAHAFGSQVVIERLADTVLGALLAWAFSYVLPSWERQSIARVVTRVQGALATLTREVLQPKTGEQADLQLRLARREAYEALGALAAVAQRTSVEPQHVRVSMENVASLHAHGHSLLAHLASVKTMLVRRADELDPAETQRALAEALANIAQWLVGRPGTADTLPETVPVAGESGLPDRLPAEAPQPWLSRRLQMATLAAARAAQAARLLTAPR
jgi:uncharacterized membrane protein YccC